MKPRIKLRIVAKAEPQRPLAKLSQAEKLHNAIAFLRSRGRYILDQGAKQPKWGIPGKGGK